MAINLHKIGTVLPMTKECESAIIISSNSGLGKKTIRLTIEKTYKKTTTFLMLFQCNKFVVVLLFENLLNY